MRDEAIVWLWVGTPALRQVTIYPMSTVLATRSGMKDVFRPLVSSSESYGLLKKFLLTQTFLYFPALERAAHNSNTVSFCVPEFGDISLQSPVMLNILIGSLSRTFDQVTIESV